MTPQEASKVVAMLMAAYPNARVPDGTVALYETLLLEFDRDRTAKAVRSIIMTSKFMPTIAEIVSAYEGERATEEVPYHRQFAPPRRRGLMRPADLAAEVNAYLAKAHPEPKPEPATPAPEPEEPSA
jgi:hypothetical protein